MQNFDFQPVIIIGAPRSGTNMLRDVLCRLGGFQTWPCDEINYIWRHDNVFVDSDEFTELNATLKAQSYIRKQFVKQSNKNPTTFLVEKTCANSLRIGFIEKIIPEAKYLFIHRNGFDAASSARKRWRSKLDLNYIFKKVRFVPLVDLPIYGARYLYHRIYKIFSSSQRLASWGPRLKNMDNVLRDNKLINVCATQWQACVDRSIDAFENISDERRLMISYERFVQSPAEEIEIICQFLGASFNEQELAKAVDGVSGEMVGKSRSDLTDEELSDVEKIISNTMKHLNYSQ